MKSYGFWEECVIVMKIRTTYKQELCSLRFQQLLSTSVIPKRKQYRTFDRLVKLARVELINSWLRQSSVCFIKLLHFVT